MMGFLLKGSPLYGIVCWWPFAIVDIPNGWHLCDGTEGTPDYRNYMLIGAGDLYAPGQVLGALTHLHTGFTDEDFVELDTGDQIDDAVGEGEYSTETYPYDWPFTTDLANHLPPCKAGCWIMKL